MKKLVLSLLLVGITNLGYSQYSQVQNIGSVKNDIEKVLGDLDYLNEVQGNNTPKGVKYLEGIVARWDATKSLKFDGRTSPFRVNFKSDQGLINVAYDSEGKIKWAIEKFKNVALPIDISRMIAKEYPNWKLVKNSYSVHYVKGKNAIQCLRIKMRKHGVNQNIKIMNSDNSL